MSTTFYSFAPAVILTPGGVVTVDETRVSLAEEATEAVVGTSTVGLVGTEDDFDGDGDEDEEEDGVDEFDENEEDEDEDEEDDATDATDAVVLEEDGLFSAAVCLKAWSMESLFGIAGFVGGVVVLVI